MTAVGQEAKKQFQEQEHLMPKTLGHMNRNEFICFCRAATTVKSGPEYEQLYQFLLQCFLTADNDYDGKVDPEEFDMMVEMAAKDVRRLGLAPTHKQTYATVGERQSARLKLFQAMDADNSGFIGFEEWLQYSLEHIAGKVATAVPGNSSTMYGSKSEFLQFAMNLSQSRASAEYKEFYRFLLQCFEDADQDRDGLVNLQEFDQLVEKAGAFPRSHGLAPMTSELYPNTEARIEGRKKLFDSMDNDKSGKISFEEWLEFTYTHVCEKVKGSMPETEVPYGFDEPGEELASFGRMGRAQFIAFARLAVTDQKSPEFEKLYQFLLQCFAAADNDYDGKVDIEEFDMMVELAAMDVRRLGLAPTHKETYKTTEERRAARKKLFDAMDADGSGYIGFEEWLGYSIGHIKEKVQKAHLSNARQMTGKRDEFIGFVQALSASRSSAEFKQFYNFLLQCFQDADQDRDGKVIFSEFDSMVEKAGAIPRMHGLAPLTADLFATAEARVAGRKNHFDAIDKTKQGYISFKDWLEFTYNHVVEKTAELGARRDASSSRGVAASLGEMRRSEFISFCRAATMNRASPEFEQLYLFLLECFQTADNDYDGKVDVEEFDSMVEMAAKDVRRLGLAPTHKQTYNSATERRAARLKLFQAMDADGSGFIGFEEWLQYALTHITEKVATAPLKDASSMYGSKAEFLRFAVALSRGRKSAEFKEFYAFLLQCFQDADQDRDGKVNLMEFDKMVEKAGAFPRLHGLAPLTNDMYPSASERIAGRKKHFESMDTANQGYISFEQWLEFTYSHVCEKVRGLADAATPVALMQPSNMSRSEFVAFCRRATNDASSQEYEALYQFLLQCFTVADNDYDGKVDVEEFDMMVELAAKDVRRLGLAPTHKQIYNTMEERRVARKRFFDSIDTEGLGHLTFERWLEFAIKHIAGKVDTAPVGDPSNMRSGKEEFLRFITCLSASRASGEYKQFYSFLLECFSESDEDRDGKVSFAEFDKMVEKAGAIPRMYGLAPLTTEMFATTEERITARRKHFEAMDTTGQGFISFEQWLDFTYAHVCKKTDELQKKATSAGGVQSDTHESVREVSQDEFETMGRSQFIAFCSKATSDSTSSEAEKLYQFLLKCFSMADNDFDGKVDLEEFDMMVELAAKDVRRLGLAPTHKQTYKNSEDRRLARKKLFDQVDAEKSGFIRFEQWLDYTLKHITGKVATTSSHGDIANMKGSKEEFLRSVTILTQPDGKETAEFKEFYRFLMECFMEADQDRDGKVNLTEFDQMVEKAGAYPRSHGLAPPSSELYKTDADRIAARKKHFEAMDTVGQGYISFEQWLEFTYDHVCQKVRDMSSP